MRRSLLVLVSALAALVAACGPTVTPSPAPPLAVPTPTRDASPTPLPEPQAPTPTASAPVVFHIVAGESEARFVVEEILAGSPKTVVGSTGDVSGEIRGSFDDPAGAEVGEVRVDLRTLRTDNAFRNRAIHDAILATGTEANRFAVFRLTAVDGLPERAEVGTTYPLQLTGDLTIHGVTRPVTFGAEVAAVSPTRLEGTASVTVRYEDFEIFILRLPPQVASVAEEVTLEIDFVAVAG